ncbi:Crinkler (CRN) family protein [Phytophthora palmivora]|uniref:Crinkler (CRN) family protein n=1 Tax=Phytophthora palmivora TaxID=4796 RepID=A0A2P4Y992_9STRA|nr:Crinkler (CRN) family protein [Phytophthora palmivora]
MDPTLWINNDKHFGKNFGPAEGEDNVVVVVPKQARSREGLSLVSESIENTLNTKGFAAEFTVWPYHI